jgi:hypothetical protein
MDAVGRCEVFGGEAINFDAVQIEVLDDSATDNVKLERNTITVGILKLPER